MIAASAFINAHGAKARRTRFDPCNRIHRVPARYVYVTAAKPDAKTFAEATTQSASL